MPMLASAEGDVSAAKAALNARAIAGLEARAAGVAPDEDSPCTSPSFKHLKPVVSPGVEFSARQISLSTRLFYKHEGQHGGL